MILPDLDFWLTFHFSRQSIFFFMIHMALIYFFRSLTIDLVAGKKKDLIKKLF
jgi:hypothetical protein